MNSGYFVVVDVVYMVVVVDIVVGGVVGGVVNVVVVSLLVVTGHHIFDCLSSWYLQGNRMI